MLNIKCGSFDPFATMAINHFCSRNNFFMGIFHMFHILFPTNQYKCALFALKFFHEFLLFDKIFVIPNMRIEIVFAEKSFWTFWTKILFFTHKFWGNIIVIVFVMFDVLTFILNICWGEVSVTNDAPIREERERVEK